VCSLENLQPVKQKLAHGAALVAWSTIAHHTAVGIDALDEALVRPAGSAASGLHLR
jgi:hypothetical protein